jgi:LAS superfamily LD-carboxypeptidase LdcB
VQALLNERQLTGRDASHLLEFADNHFLLPEAAQAFADLQSAAQGAGFDLAIASSFRSYDRQLAIFNGKARGERSVHDDEGEVLPIADMPPAQRLQAILRFSALPGTSRHHWGTDLDVFDAGAIAPGYQLQLSPQEVAPGGLFDDLHCWLDERLAADESYGFFRPYSVDRGGVAVERWHLSYASIATQCASRLSAELLRQCWNEGNEALCLQEQVEQQLGDLLARYVSVPADWCPGCYQPGAGD